MAMDKFKCSPFPTVQGETVEPGYIRQLVRVLELYTQQLDSRTPNNAERYTANVFAYSGGSGGTQTQGTSKSTAVTLDKTNGEITTHDASLAANTAVSFTLNDAYIEAGDQIVVTHHSGGTVGAYLVVGRATGAGTASITIRNVTSGPLSEALVLKFTIIKTVTY